MTSAEPTTEQTDLAAAQAAWDAIDIDRVRNVAWTAIPYFMERNLARLGAVDGRADPHARVRRLLAERTPESRHRSLVGGVLLCGDMRGEAPLFREGHDLAFAHVDGFDLSPASLERVDAPGLPFEGHVADCNELELEPGRYDLLVGHHGIHHVRELRHLFAQAQRGLRDTGLMMIDEWIGPPYLQLPRRNAFFARLLLFTLYPKPRSRTNHMGQRKGVWLAPPPEAFDPSEACNSDVLLPEYHRHFEPVAEVRYGGLAYPVFEGIGHTIDMGRWTNKLRVRIVYLAERVLTALGLVRPLFVSSIGRPRRPASHGSGSRGDAS